MKSKKILIIILTMIIVIVGICFWKQKNEENKLAQDEQTSFTSYEYVLGIEETEDYSLLTIKTNIITEPFKFQFDNTKFILDTSSKLFDEAIIQSDEEKTQKQVIVNLVSNEVYKFYFIKKENAKLELEKTLIIGNE